ncbi:MAG: flagellar basal-body rod protein FlgG [Campylobacterota bacterium]|nr:flagellar basal-body rod protein FlgG [Campylobacterota bacterium]
MIRGLYTAASGMVAQQQNIDVISNNIANVNTTGFKQDRAEFQDLMYQSLNYTAGATSSTTNNPTGIDVGLGVKTAAVKKDFMQGTLQNTGGDFDMAIAGRGFFKVEMPNGDEAYTRDGVFTPTGPGGTLVNSSGYPLVDQIDIPTGTTKISIGQDGKIEGILAGDTLPTDLGEVFLTDFINPSGLNPIGKNLYLASSTSGNGVVNTPGLNGLGTIEAGFIEKSNVQLVTEMVNLITAQRAYEANSKSITTTDTMLQTVNQLKR